MIEIPKPREKSSSDIKLLRLDLIPTGNSLFEELGDEWTPAQPTNNLSPEKAATFLNVEIWELPSVIKKRYKTLQLRYPPEQFPDKHLEWRPSFELLSNSKARFNWYWQSGLIPIIYSEKPPKEDVLWDSGCYICPSVAQKMLQNVVNNFKKQIIYEEFMNE